MVYKCTNIGSLTGRLPKTSFESDPKNFAVLLFAMQKSGDARAYNARAVAANPNDTDVLYMQGVIDWVMAYQFRMETKSRLGLTPLAATHRRAGLHRGSRGEPGEGGGGYRRPPESHQAAA